MSSEGLTIQQAIAELSAPVEPETNEQAQPQPAAQEADQASATTDEGSEADAPGDAGNTENEPEAEAIQIEPPKWWSKEKKDQFKALSPELQAVVFEQEEIRERVVSKAKQESADARRAAEAEKAELQRRVSALDAILPHAAQTFQSRWANVDWQKLAGEVDAQTYNQYRAAFEQEQRNLQTLQAENQRTSEERLKAFDAEQSEKLKTVAPDLADEKLGLQRRQEVAKFLIENGKATELQVRLITAELSGIAYDAMRWRKAQAETTARANAPKPAVQQPAPVRPSSPAARTPTEARIKEAQAAFDRNPSVKNLEALERLRAH